MPPTLIIITTTMAQSNELGKWGEQKAADYLEANGYTILDRDWKCGRRDLDIVAYKDGLVVIVEVKTRRNTAFTMPEQNVNIKKIRSISFAADSYMKCHKRYNQLRFDIISIVGTSDDDCKISHIEDAFMPVAVWRH